MLDRKDDFIPVFREDESRDPFLNDNDKPEALKQQIEAIERREQKIKEMLEALEEAYEMLRKRSDALNKKEEMLNREYLKLLEIESMYQGTDKLADSLSAMLPGANQTDEETEATETDEAESHKTVEE